MDKRWMTCNRTSDEYDKGVNDFLDFAFHNTRLGDVITCPCIKCNNALLQTRDEVKEHLMVDGIVKSYTRWLYHGESTFDNVNDKVQVEGCDDIFGMIHDAAGPKVMDAIMQDVFEQGQGESNIPAESLILDENPCKLPSLNKETSKFLKLLEDAQQNLYPDCKNFTKLSFIVKFFQLKCLYGLSDEATNGLMQLFKQALPDGETLPKTFYEARKIIRDLGLTYEKIDACVNDCMLFWKNNAHLDSCLKCGESRWQSNNSEKGSKKVPKKVLRYFPLKPRLQRLFMSSKTAVDMRWHHDERLKDGILRHPADSFVWKSFDESNPGFAVDPRNVRLGLSTDGINPFGNMSVSHSTWPVIITVYNLPPWMCMKQPYCMLTLLIPGPKAPGNDIDVYLQPLIDELKDLWYNGIHTYDASKKEDFCMRVAVLWTISDFPAYAYLSGWSTKGTLACPLCNKETPSFRLKYSRKFCYMRARRFLHKKHKWRVNRNAFDGTIEKGLPPYTLSGDDVLNQLCKLQPAVFGKSVKKSKGGKNKDGLNWKKKSIFFELPYWRKIILRHNLDVMHIEKNVCENIFGTILDIEGKTKDGLNARRDLKEMGIRRELHPYQKDGKWYYPAACFSLSNEEKNKICKFLKDLKVPDRFSSNISRCVNLKERKIYGLKSHDCHILLEHILPLAIRGIVPSNVYDAIMELSIFYKELCSKVLKVDELQRLESQIPITLSKLEKIFPPSFFDVMVHLTIHLATEAKFAGPVQYRWMYPIERFLRKLKCYVRNKSRPEGSIAEGYIVEESLIFCSRYLHGIETKFNQPKRNCEGDCNNLEEGLSVFAQIGYPLTKDKSKSLEDTEIKQAHDYVLKNCKEIQPFLNEYEQIVHDMDFSGWLYNRVKQLHKEGDIIVSEELLSLAQGPLCGVQRFMGYVINGFRFHIKKLERKRVNQNSGVLVKGVMGSKSVDYYGVLTEILELQYLGGKRIVLFRCDWWDVDKIGKGIKIDKHGLVSVNTSRKLITNEPFVLASQAEQVFYVKDGNNPNWLIILKSQPENIYDFLSKDEPEIDMIRVSEEVFQQNISHFSQELSTIDEDDDLINLERGDMNEFTADINPIDEILVEEDIESDPDTDDEDLLL